ncbi:MAG: PIN domain-containing protein [Eggerthellaceae bacterium]|nr:PIN domain-containing protein [Eggerthellaceae bacterium]
MSSENPIALLDTNVWLDHFLGNRPKSAHATNLITYAAAHDITLAYSAGEVKDVYYLIGQELKRERRKTAGTLTQSDALACSEVAWACVDNMTALATAISVGEPQVWLARHFRSLHNDFEDNLVLAALETSKADVFVTNDETIRSKSPVPSFSPEDTLAYWKM